MHTIEDRKTKWLAAKTGISPTSWNLWKKRKENTNT